MSSVRTFGATGDGKTDDTAAIQHAVNDGDGLLRFPPGQYRISKPIQIDLTRRGPIGVEGSGGTAKILMAGPGPALRLVGSHGGTGDPGSVKPEIWTTQRLPTIQNIEIQGAHPEADGIELLQTMQSVFEGVLIHQVRNGIRLFQRNRNVLISHCHIYNNTGVGVFLDQVNLHQINIASNHISYNRLGGIRIEQSEVRNLQITGNDIEYNNHRAHGADPEPTAEIYIDTSVEKASVNEITIASNTIQATPSSGGANIFIREMGSHDRPPGLWAISGNIIGSQENNVHLIGCYGVVLSGNCIYSCTNRNLLLENCRQINVGGNSFRRHTPRMGTGIRLVKSTDCVVHGCTIRDEAAEGQVSQASLLELEQCARINVQGCQMVDPAPYGIDVNQSDHINISGCTVMDTREKSIMKGCIRFRGTGRGNLITASTLGAPQEQALQLDPAAGTTTANNQLGR